MPASLNERASAAPRLPGVSRDIRRRGTNTAIAALVRRVVDPELTLAEFARSAEALQVALDTQPSVARATGSAAGTWCPEPPDGVLLVHPKVEAAIKALHIAASSGRYASEDEVAITVGVQAAYLGRLLKRYTGKGFREWRRAILMRVAAYQLVNTHEHVDQIAYCVGYDHAAQFSRDFRLTFGTSPRNFCHLYAGAERLVNGVSHAAGAFRV